jgi:hypothetical protein
MPRRFTPAASRPHCAKFLKTLSLLLPLAACAAPRPQAPAPAPQPVAQTIFSGTILSIRPESAAQDSTGSLQQIMTILGQPAPQPLNASEIVLRLPDGTIKTSVQAPQDSLSVGGKAAITAAAASGLQPY